MFRRSLRILSLGTGRKTLQLASLSISMALLNQYRLHQRPTCIKLDEKQPIDIFSAILQKTKNKFLIIYSEQTNRPVGAGVIIDNQGTFITVTDVVADSEIAKYTYVKGPQGKQYTFKVLTVLQQEKLTICRLEKPDSNFQAVELAESQIGQNTYTISKDFSDFNVFNESVVLESNFTLNPNLIDQKVLHVNSPFILLKQQDTPLSGSPVFNQQGKLIGITRKEESLQDRQVAVTSTFFRQLVNNYVEPKRAFIGLSVKNSEQGGAFIIKINSDSPADQAGLRLGEVIKQINGITINHATDISKILGFQSGFKVDLLVDRDGKQRTVHLITQ